MKKNLVKATLVCGLTLVTLSTPLATVVSAAPSTEEQDAKLDKIKEKEKSAAEELAKIKEDVEAKQQETKELLAKKDKTQKEVKSLDNEIDKLNDKIKKRNKQLESQARTVQVQGDTTNFLSFILNADSITDAINRAQTVSQIVGANRAIVQEQQTDKDAVQTKKSVANKKLAEQNKIMATLEKNKGELEAKQLKQEALVADIAAEKATTEKEKSDLLAQKNAAEKGIDAIQTAFNGGGGSGVVSAVNVNPNASGSAIVAEAQRHLGAPYAWGGKGPNVFDCSGFTSYVYRQVTGKEIGGFTVPQESAGVQIPVSAAQPGDLLFWGDRGNTYHVAIATGGGGYIHAPTEGQTVSYGSVGSYAPSFAVRVQ